MMTRGVRLRLPLLALAGLALLAAMWSGLVRMGWALPPLRATWVTFHGPLMISGFLGTLISLERAVALSAMHRNRWPYAAPALAALGGLALLVGLPDLMARALFVASGAVLLAMFVVIYRLSPDWAHLTMGLGAALWLAGSGLWWAGVPIFRVVPWWAGFLVLTIAGERLELARLLVLRRGALWTFLLGAGLLLVGLVLSLGPFAAGVRASGAGIVWLGLWLVAYDLARRTIRQRGLPRFIAACLLPGYLWLVFTGALWLLWADRFAAGPAYDAMLHSLLLGFVFSMIFGHAPIIIPAVVNVGVSYHRAYYAPLVLLHVGLALRVAGDLALNLPLRQWGGLVNVLAILLFLGNTIGSVVTSARGAPAPP